MSDPATLADMVETSVPLVTRYLAGFTDANRAAQAPALPNHVIWSLGHMALYMHRACEKIDPAVLLPERHFAAGQPLGADPDRFDTESVCFGSTPLAQPELYPRLDRGLEIFELSCARLADLVRGLDRSEASRMTEWGAARHRLSVAQLVTRMVVHNANHAGQIIDLRRALGLGTIV